jgi:hypothetical protein
MPMPKQHRNAAPLILAAGLLCASMLAGIAPADAQSGPPNFSGADVGWVSVGGSEWKAVPGGPAPVGQDPAHVYVPNNVGGQPTFRMGDAGNPNLTQFAKDSLKKSNDDVLAGKPMWSRSARCYPSGVPAFMLIPVQPMFFVQTPREVLIIAQHDSDVRHIYLDVPHSEHPKPSWYGESVGHYEGDTLVVDTIGQNDRTFVDNFRTPHSEKLHVVERFRLADGGKFLNMDIVMDDPAVFLKPLHVTKRSRRVEASWTEWRCIEGEMNDPFADGAEPLLIAKKADF